MTAPCPALALDKQAIAALEALGLAVSDEKITARIGDVAVAVKRTADLRMPEFEFEIDFPTAAC